jgi:hypothetical protein
VLSSRDEAGRKGEESDGRGVHFGGCVCWW